MLCIPQPSQASQSLLEVQSANHMPVHMTIEALSHNFSRPTTVPVHLITKPTWKEEGRQEEKQIKKTNEEGVIWEFSKNVLDGEMVASQYQIRLRQVIYGRGESSDMNETTVF